jgi:PhzF family phenazine biosynthesis protein
MEIPIYTVDAFSTEPFKGNPAAVCLLDQSHPSEWMQRVAAEMNLSETAFVVPRANETSTGTQTGEGGFNLRWFTPTVEVPLCGHATLASAHTLWESGKLSRDEEARFHTQSGWLKARRKGALIEMDFPSLPVTESELPEKIREALGVPARWVGRTANHGAETNLLVELESEDAVRDLRPDFAALRQHARSCIIVTARATTPGLDFVSRFFASHVGIDEDPVTGSAHCSLAPYWAARLGKTDMIAYQASPRGGEVRVRMGDGRVLLGGRAITVLRGTLLA